MTPFGARLRAALLGGRRHGVRGAGATSLRRSDGYEFAELRAYVDGDDPRRIDWAATARAGDVQTRVMFEERALTLAVAIDASASMRVGRRRSNYDLACDAAALFYAAAADDDRCARFGERATFFHDVRGTAGGLACAAIRDPGVATLGTALRSALALAPRDTRLLAIGDGFDFATERALLAHAALRFDLTVLFARDPWRDGLPLGGFVRLRDAESGRSQRLYVGGRERARYRTATLARETAALAELRALGARVATLDVHGGAEGALAEAFAL